jgi:predicted short-subunit dehydrogenase-like oxidoreductase (DUF2520 family)
MARTERSGPADRMAGSSHIEMPEKRPHPETLVLAIVGAGRAGGALARASSAAGIEVRVAGREGIPSVVKDADAALLCVPDDEIATACDALVEHGVPAYVGHVSGATSLAALGSASDVGAEVFSLHPLQTIPHGDTDLTGAPSAVAGFSPGAVAFATALAERIGMRPFAVDEADRTAYHAAASIASNFLVALEESATELLAEAGVGVEDARELLRPLVLRTAANWAEHGAAALTGPIARGDAATVERHLAELRERSPELVPLYEALAERTRAIAAHGVAT